MVRSLRPSIPPYHLPLSPSILSPNLQISQQPLSPQRIIPRNKKCRCRNRWGDLKRGRCMRLRGGEGGGECESAELAMGSFSITYLFFSKPRMSPILQQDPSFPIPPSLPSLFPSCPSSRTGPYFPQELLFETRYAKQ